MLAVHGLECGLVGLLSACALPRGGVLRGTRDGRARADNGDCGDGENPEQGCCRRRCSSSSNSTPPFAVRSWHRFPVSWVPSCDTAPPLDRRPLRAVSVAAVSPLMLPLPFVFELRAGTPSRASSGCRPAPRRSSRSPRRCDQVRSPSCPASAGPRGTVVVPPPDSSRYVPARSRGCRGWSARIRPVLQRAGRSAPLAPLAVRDLAAALAPTIVGSLPPLFPPCLPDLAVGASSVCVPFDSRRLRRSRRRRRWHHPPASLALRMSEEAGLGRCRRRLATTGRVRKVDESAGFGGADDERHGRGQRGSPCRRRGYDPATAAPATPAPPPAAPPPPSSPVSIVPAAAAGSGGQSACRSEDRRCEIEAAKPRRSWQVFRCGRRLQRSRRPSRSEIARRDVSHVRCRDLPRAPERRTGPRRPPSSLRPASETAPRRSPGREPTEAQRMTIAGRCRSGSWPRSVTRLRRAISGSPSSTSCETPVSTASDCRSSQTHRLRSRTRTNSLCATRNSQQRRRVRPPALRPAANPAPRPSPP